MRSLLARARCVVLAVLPLIAACNIPGRDNPKDPSNVPEARVEIYADLVGGDPIVQSAYTESIFLAAGKSEPSNHDLRVRWSVAVPGIDEPLPINDGQEYRVADGRTAFRFNNAIPAGFALPETGALGVTILAEVRDANTGGSSVGTRFFQVFNRPPVISVPPYREVPPGGRWWTNPPSGIETLLDAIATDPDSGDTVTVTWEQVGGRGVATRTTSEDLVVEVPLWEQTVVFRIRARDEALSETFADVTLAVQDVVWVADGSGLVQRVQEPPVSVPIVSDSWIIGAATNIAGKAAIWTAEDDGTWVIVRRAPEVGATVEEQIDTGLVASANELHGGTVTAAGVAWVAAGDRLLAVADSEPLVAPVVVASNFSLVTLAADGITAPHGLVPVTGSVNGDVWALVDEADPTVRRISTANGPAATGAAIPSALAIEPAADGGAWVLVSDPSDDTFPPRIARVDAQGALTATSLDLPFPATAKARVFGARSPLHQVEPLRFAIAGGDTPANAYLALVEARDSTCNGAPSDGLTTGSVLCVTYRLQEAPVSDIALDPQDGAAWSVVPSTGRVRKHLFDGTVLRSAGDLTFDASSTPPTLRADLRTGFAWVADQGGALRGIPGAPFVPYPDSAALSSPDRLELDPVRNRLAVSGNGDASVVVLSEGELRNQFFLPDLGAPGGPVGATMDPDSACLWLASEPGPGGVPASRLRRHLCKDGSSVLANVTSGGIVQIQAISLDPIEGGLCVAGLDTDGFTRVSVLEPDGMTVRSTNVVTGTVVRDVHSSPYDGACWFLTDTAVGRVDAVSNAFTETATGTTEARSLATAPDGSALFVVTVVDSSITRVRPQGVGGCLSTFCVSTFSDFNGAAYRNARSIAVDPVRGIVWVTLGPEPGDETPAALLQLSPEGDRLGLVPASDPEFITVNR